MPFWHRRGDTLPSCAGQAMDDIRKKFGWSAMVRKEKSVD